MVQYIDGKKAGFRECLRALTDDMGPVASM